MSYVPPSQTAFARLSGQAARRMFGREMRSAGVFAQHPRLLRAFTLFNRAIERDDRVPARLKELAILQAAAMNGCPFCLDIGSMQARRAGVSEEQVLHLHDAHASGLFDADEMLIIDFATAVTATPPTVDEELVARVRARHGDRGTVELAHVVGWENHRSRMNRALGIEAEGFSEGAACARAQLATGAPVA